MLPLEGIKVVENTLWGAGPAAGALLADWGADVIKVESTAGGDPMRYIGGDLNLPFDNYNPMFEIANRNKRSMAIDLKTEAGRAAVHELIKRADVYLTSVREKALRTLGLDYETLSGLNPRLIFAHITGHGRKGRDAGLGSFDGGAYWGRGGFLLSLGEEGTPPVGQGGPGLGDQPTGAFMAGGVTLALFARERTGQGQRVDVSLLSSAVWVQGYNIVNNMFREFKRAVPQARTNPMGGTYLTKDGKLLLFIMGLQSDRYWPEFCRVMGLEGLADDPRFAKREARAKNGVEAVAMVEKIIATKTRDEWLDILRDTNLHHEPVNTYSEIAADPQVIDNGYLPEYTHPRAGKIRLPLGPVQMESAPVSYRRPAPGLGEHTEEILLEIGYDKGTIGSLRKEGVIL